MTVLTGMTLGLSLVIYLVIPNEGRGPVLGIDGLRNALLAFVWITFGTFAIASTALLSIIPQRWFSALRLLVAYAGGIVAVGVVSWLIANL